MRERVPDIVVCESVACVLLCESVGVSGVQDKRAGRASKHRGNSSEHLTHATNKNHAENNDNNKV